METVLNAMFGLTLESTKDLYVPAHHLCSKSCLETAFNSTIMSCDTMRQLWLRASGSFPSMISCITSKQAAVNGCPEAASSLTLLLMCCAESSPHQANAMDGTLQNTQESFSRLSGRLEGLANA